MEMDELDICSGMRGEVSILQLQEWGDLGTVVYPNAESFRLSMCKKKMTALLELLSKTILQAFLYPSQAPCLMIVDPYAHAKERNTRKPPPLRTYDV